ncbi:MAG: aspartate-semialdehyde dehydrogenase [Candidatus Omnitrophica bacterium]|nr:aspartate-semialdehyde dehydrogenase [Candidatus Omnitrophota bacterium]
MSTRARATKRYTVAVVGATGAVGTEMLRVLAERKFPVGGLRLLASERSAGRRMVFKRTSYPVERLAPGSFDGVDIALFSAGAARSLEFAPEAVKRGAVVVDNSSAFRMREDVPLVVPEVNPHALRSHRGLIANPNCSTIVLLVALKPLHDAARLARITVATYQSVSGAGAKAMAQLYEEAKRIVRQCRVTSGEWRVNSKLKTQNAKRKTVLPSQIAFNLVPQVDVFLENGATKEERKMVQETRKILEEPALPVSATCVRVPVFIAHSEAVWIQTERPLSVEEARRLLQQAPGVRLVDERTPGGYPMPVDAAGRDEVLVGRIRKDESVPNGLVLWLSGDNLRKGAATNAVQIAELLIKKRGQTPF